MVFKAGEGAGLSGSFFFFSRDNRFLIKTLTRSERDLFLNMLDKYINHLEATHNESLLARIYGIFTIKTNFFHELDIMVMQNTARLTKRKNQKITFDIKGSKFNRH
jgi:1-phosphatidylinositol-4-phosphate 5-kinase